MIKYGRWKIWADDEQWIMCSRVGTAKNGQPTIIGTAYYYGTVESLFRGLYQQCLRDNATDCETLQQIAILARRTGADLEKVIRHAFEFSPATEPKTAVSGGLQNVAISDREVPLPGLRIY